MDLESIQIDLWAHLEIYLTHVIWGPNSEGLGANLEGLEPF